MRHPNRSNLRQCYCLCVLVVLTMSVQQHAYAAEGNKIHVIETKYGDFLGDKTCAPPLPLCEGRDKCSVEVGDSLCKSGADPTRAQLQVIWDCGDLTHAGRAIRGKKVTLTCPYHPNLNP